MARSPDIIQHQSIPLSATTDAPVDDVARPPLNASGNADDQASGIAPEISPEEAAQAIAARRGDPATSDMNDPPVDDGAKPDPKVAKEAKADPDETNLIDDDGVAIDPTKAPNWAVKEVARLRKATRERVEGAQAEAKKAVDDAAAAKADLEKTRLELETLRAKAPPEPKIDADPRPGREGFDDPDLYDEALTAWTDREADRKATAKIAENDAIAAKAKADAEAAETAKVAEETRVARDAELKTISDTWDAAVLAAKEEKYPDWDDVVMKTVDEGGPMVTEVMGAMIAQAPNGTDMAYYLAANVDESKRIAAINNPFLQAMELGKLSQQLAQPRRAAARPRPIEPVQTNRTPPENPDPDNEDMDAYYARRSKETTPNRQPFFPPGGLH